MSEAKYTEGPWYISFGGKEGDGFATVASRHTFNPIAELNDAPGYHNDEVGANARLIASAPDLLEMLSEVCMRIDWEGSFRPNTVLVDAEIYIKVKAAIAKAKGE